MATLLLHGGFFSALTNIPLFNHRKKKKDFCKKATSNLNSNNKLSWLETILLEEMCFLELLTF